MDIDISDTYVQYTTGSQCVKSIFLLIFIENNSELNNAINYVLKIIQSTYLCHVGNI